MRDDNPLVYSTESGRIRPQKAHTASSPTFNSDGIVRLQRQKSGRKGQGVTLITGIVASEAELRALASELKKGCGCGGAVKNGAIEIQGDKREPLKSLLEAKGYRVKLAGG